MSRHGSGTDEAGAVMEGAEPGNEGWNGLRPQTHTHEESEMIPMDHIDDVVTERLMDAADAHAEALYGEDAHATDIDVVAAVDEADEHAYRLSEDAA